MMTSRRQFPALVTQPLPGGRVRASAVLRLVEIEPQTEANWRAKNSLEGVFQKRASFIQALGVCKNTSIELRFAFKPALSAPAHSRVHAFLVRHAVAGHAHEARQLVLAQGSALKPLLSTFWPHAEFQPVTSQNAVAAILCSLTEGTAVALTRQSADFEPSFTGTSDPIHHGFGRQANPLSQPLPGRLRYTYPWIPSNDSWTTLFETLLRLPVPTSLILRLIPKLASCDAECERLWHDLQTLESPSSLVGAGASPHPSYAGLRVVLQERIASLREGCFGVCVGLQSPAAIDPRICALLGQAITTPTNSEQSRLGGTQGGFSWRLVSLAELNDPQYQPEEDLFTIAEATCAFRLPQPTGTASMGLPVSSFASRPARVPAAGSGDVMIGINRHQGTENEIPLSEADRLRHVYVVGVTGSGKSTLIENMILQDIEAGRGVAFFDPHGETIDKLIGKIPEARIDDVILFDPLDHDRPLGFNLLSYIDNYERDFLIDQLHNALHNAYNLFSTGGPIFEQYFRGYMQLIMGNAESRYPHALTLLEFPLVMTNRKCEKRLADGLRDRQAQAFLEMVKQTSGESDLKNMAPYVVSKLNRFVYDLTLKYIIGQSGNVFDFRSIMDQGKIVFVKLGKGRLGAGAADILCAAFVARLQSAAFARANIEHAHRRPFFVYIDEFQNLVSPAFADMLAEIRKYKVGLTLVHQFTDQLVQKSATGTINLLPAVLGNVGTTIAFRRGAVDAELLAPSFALLIAKENLMNLPSYTAYVRGDFGATYAPPFNLSVKPASKAYELAIAERVRLHSRLAYGRDRSEVEREIEERYEWLTTSGHSKGHEKEISLEDLFAG